MKATRSGIAVAAASLGLLVGCPLAPAPGISKPQPEPGELEERRELFVPDLEEPCRTVFWVNSREYWGPEGVTLWAPTGAPPQDPFLSRTVAMQKASGDAAAGFGLVFCQYAMGPSRTETMLVVMVNTDQQYIIGEVIGGEFSRITPWTYCPNLLEGSALNTVALSLEGSEFVLSINDSVATRFSDRDPPLHAGGADGYIVVVSPQDQFPEVPVHVIFREVAR